MSATLKISGETGKKFGSSRVSLDALGIERPQLRLASLADEQLSFTQTYTSPLDAGVEPFDEGQKVELFGENGRIFSGHFLHSVPSDSGDSFMMKRVITGPWFWMQTTPLTGIVDPATSSERAVLVFPNGNLAAHIRTLLTRAIALGVPIQIGEIAECYDIPQVTLKRKSVADGLAELMARLPDGVVEMDHSGSGFPKVHIHRRDSMQVETFKRGVIPLSKVDLKPRVQSVAKEVRVTYTARDPNTGSAGYYEQIAGGSENGFPDRQIISVSGDELGDLPDSGDGIWHPTSGTVASFITEGVVYGSNMTAGPATVSLFTSHTGSGGTPSSQQVEIVMSSSQITYSAGAAFPTSGWKFFKEFPDWLAAQLGVTVVPVVGIGALYHTWNPTGSYSSWIDKVAWTQIIHGYNANYSDPYVPNTHARAVGKVGVNVTGYAVTGYDFGTRPIIRYDYVEPPKHFARNLLRAQSWTPYEGRIELTEQNAGDVPYLARCFNIRESLPAFGSMRALPQSVDIDFDQGKTTINTGVPPRQSLGGLVERVKQNEDDNIVYA